MPANRYDRSRFRLLLNRISRQRERLTGYAHWSKIDFTLDEVRSFLNAGEEGLAFELLADNLYEFQFPLRSELYAEFEAIGPSIGIPSGRWAFLKEMVSE